MRNFRLFIKKFECLLPRNIHFTPPGIFTSHRQEYSVHTARNIQFTPPRIFLSHSEYWGFSQRCNWKRLFYYDIAWRIIASQIFEQRTVSSSEDHFTQLYVSEERNYIQISYQLDAPISPFYYPDVYLQLNMFRAFSCPSSRAQQL
jgi:hypothetical protein